MLTFCIELYDSSGSEIQTMELIPNGRNISLNNENKLKFIELYVDF